MPLFGKMVAAARGINKYSDAELAKVGERMFNLERVFNIREGFRSKDDTLPERVQKEPLLEAEASTGQTFSNLQGMIQEYYQARGWTDEGFPPPEKLRKLGLEQAARDIETIISHPNLEKSET